MDSKKNLLNEATVRRFMKLAELEPLVNPFVENIVPEEVVTEDEEDRYDYEKGKDAGEAEDAEDVLGGEEELEVDLDAEDELDIEDELEDAGEEASMEEKVRDFLEDVAIAATKHLGVATEVETDIGEVEDVPSMGIDAEDEEVLDVADLGEPDEDVDVDDEDIELQEDTDEELEEAVTEDQETDWGGNKKEFKRRTKKGVKGKTGDIGGGKYGKGGHFKTYEKGSQNENTDRTTEEITRRVVKRLLDAEA